MATETEYKAIIDREKHKRDFDEHFSDVKKLLQDIVNYGSKLMPRCFVSSERKLEDAIIIGVLLRQVIAMVDATEVLISNAAIYSSQIQARAGFEASIYIEWILKGHTEKKAKYFYVSNLRKDKLWAQRITGESPDQTEFDEMLREFSSQLIEKTDEMKEEARNQIEEIDRLLGSTTYSDINNDFQSYKDSRSLPYEPSWYAPLGITSVRQMAIDLERLAEYELFYSFTSEVMHSSRYRPHVHFNEGKLTFEPIRSLKGIKTLVDFVVACTLKAYRNILDHYRHEELTSFSRKYVEDWRTPFRSVKSVRYSAASETITI